MFLRLCTLDSRTTRASHLCNYKTSSKVRLGKEIPSCKSLLSGVGNQLKEVLVFVNIQYKACLHVSEWTDR